MKKVLFIIMDGLADRPIKEIGGTPLEVAKTPNLDQLIDEGMGGLVETFKFPGEKYPSSEGGHLGLFNYNKYYFGGRGPYQALGEAINIDESDVVLRCNFATVVDGKVVDRRAGRISKKEKLIQEIHDITIRGVRFRLYDSYGHRAVLVMSGSGIKKKILGNDNKKVGIRPRKITPVGTCRQSKFTADVLNEYIETVHGILNKLPSNKRRKLPANYLLVRGAGSLKKIPSFRERYGMGGCCVAGGALYKGIAKSMGMEIINDKEFTGFANTNLDKKIKTVKSCFKKKDFVFLHIKATDSLAEDGDYLGKKKFIEKIDKAFKPLLSLKDTIIVITADHMTASEKKRHDNGHVPILLWGDRKDDVVSFSEKACRRGKLGIIKANQVMKLIQKVI